MATRKQNNIVEEINTEEVKLEEKKETKNTKRLITKDTEVVVMNNTKGLFSYDCPKTHDRYEMSDYGDTDTMTIEHLNTMKNQHRTILEKYWILPIEVIDENIELKDVLEYLRIDSLYENIELDVTFFDDLILKSNVQKFKKSIGEMSKAFIERIAERAIMLFKDGRFADHFKMRAMEELLGNENLFADAEK
jgi:hypothetical protein